MTRLEKIVLLMTYWTVGEAVEDAAVSRARWDRLTAGTPKTESNLLDFIGYIVNDIDETRMDWTAFRGFMENKDETYQSPPSSERLARGIDVVN